MSKPRVMIADDHPVWAEGLGALLLKEGFEVCPPATTLDEVLPMALGSRPDVCLLDLSFARQTSISVIEDLCRALPGLRVVVVSAQTAPSTVAECIRRGAAGYFSKALLPLDLLAALHSVVEGNALPVRALGKLPTRIMKPLHVDAPQLSPLQRKVLQELALGAPQGDVAQRLGLSRKAVEYHVRRAREKSGIQALHLLIDWGRSTGQIQ